MGLSGFRIRAPYWRTIGSHYGFLAHEPWSTLLKRAQGCSQTIIIVVIIQIPAVQLYLSGLEVAHMHSYGLVTTTLDFRVGVILWGPDQRAIGLYRA